MNDQVAQDEGVIYVLTNPHMPGLVKIGCTTGEVEDRARDLSSATGVPVAFLCHFAARVKGMAKKERTLHELFSDKRVNPKREFFQVAPEKVVLALSLGDFQEVTPGKVSLSLEEDQAAEKAEQSDSARRSRINLAAIGIAPGTQLTLSRGEAVHCEVVENNKVRFRDRITSLSDAAASALQELGYKSTSVSGSDYWMYDNKTLDEFRVEREQINEAANEQ